MPTRIRRRVALLVLTLLAILPATRSSADEYYYAIVFGSQSHPKVLRYSHTWATFVRAVGTGSDLSTYALEEVTISWLPASLVVRVLAHEPEPGVNLGPYETIRYVQSNRENITAWGPFAVTPLLYQRALAQAARLRSGTVRYRALSGPRDLSFSDCIHAVADVDPQLGRGSYPLIRVGTSASRYIAMNVRTRSLMDQERDDNAWLVQRIGLESLGVKVIRPRDTPKLHFAPEPLSPP